MKKILGKLVVLGMSVVANFFVSAFAFAAQVKDISVVCEVQSDERKTSSSKKIGLSVEFKGTGNSIGMLDCKANYGTTTFDKCYLLEDNVDAYYKSNFSQTNLAYNVKSKSISVYEVVPQRNYLEHFTGVCK